MASMTEEFHRAIKRRTEAEEVSRAAAMLPNADDAAYVMNMLIAYYEWGPEAWNEAERTLTRELQRRAQEKHNV